MQFAVAVMAVMIQTTSASSTCPAPQPPPVERPQKPTRPPVPSCVNETTSTHTCRAAVINAYQRDMAAYGQAFNAHVQAVNAYVDALNGYMQAVNDYIRCERQVVMPSDIIVG